MRQRIKMRVLAGLLLVGLVSTTLVATSPASAGDVPGPAITGSTKAGYLDRSFVGGKGYRSIPKPSDASGQGLGVDLAISSGGLIRTLSRHEISHMDGLEFYVDRALLRSWTSNGWVDNGFYSGHAKNMGFYDDESGIGVLTSTVNESVSLVKGFGQYTATTMQRIKSNGRLDLAKNVFYNDLFTSFDIEFLSTGKWITCEASENSYLPQTLTFYSAAGTVTGTKAFPGEFGCVLSAAGSHLWVTGAGSTNIVRMSLDGQPDSQWGGDGSITSNISPGVIAGRSDGSLYAWGTKTVNGSSRFGIARFTSTGTPDSTWGNAGFASIGGAGTILKGRTVTFRRWSIGPKGPVLSLDVQSTPSGGHRYRLIRLNNAGELDPTFGSGGIIQTTTLTTALAHDSRGRIVTLDRSATGTVTLARRNG